VVVAQDHLVVDTVEVAEDHPAVVEEDNFLSSL
jgi:hypothetical protein